MIPSLVALRAFEATARCGSYVEAARELNVTDAALRQHVRTLENHFDTRLIERSGRGISMTADGNELAAGISGGFLAIQNTVERLLTRNSARAVRVALTPAFAENWLMPRLPVFWEEHPDIEIDLAPSIKSVDLGRGEHDFAIRYGMGDWPDCDPQMVASAAYIVVASANLSNLSRATKVHDLKNAVWLFENGREEHRQWASDHGLMFESEQNRFYPSNSLVLSAVRAGHGYCVQSHALVETDLETGNLVALFREENSRLGYYLIHQGSLRQKAVIFSNWLLSQSGPK